MAPSHPEPLVVKTARRRANHRIAFLGHAVIYAGVCLLVFVAGDFLAAVIVAIAWGIGLATHGFFGVVAPVLRERWVSEEVDRQVERKVQTEVDVSVDKERRILGEEHARSMHRLSAAVAHEIRNPITAAKSLVQQMGEDPSAPENVDYARVAIEELDRVERSIAHLLRYAREQELTVADVHLNEVIRSAVDSFRDRLERVSLDCSLDPADALRGDSEALRRVVINLIGNALEAIDEAKPEAPAITIESGHDLADRALWLRVRDNGVGIDPARAGEIFDPFYTSKAGGTGLGLAICKKIVEAHGGSIEAVPNPGVPNPGVSGPGQGSEIVVTLPRKREAA